MGCTSSSSPNRPVSNNAPETKQTQPQPQTKAKTEKSNVKMPERNASSNTAAPLTNADGNITFQAQLSANKPMEEFPKIYLEEKVLGEGITGSVRVVSNRKTGEKFAMKAINLSCLDPHQLEELRNEIRMLKTLDHPNVVSLRETYEDANSIKLVMEYLTGGELAKRRLKKESEVINVIGQILSAIQHCHNNGIVHRDLKLENVVFQTPAQDSIVKVIDFGLSRGFIEKVVKPSAPQQQKVTQIERLLETTCGTSYYMAPEVIAGSYGKECDIWAIGVMAYLLLTGHAPFEGPSEDAIFRKIKRGTVDYKDTIWTKLSPHALELVQHLLDVNVSTRWTASQALQSPWFNKWLLARESVLKQTKAQGSISKNINLGAEEVTLEAGIFDSIKRFSEYSKLKKLALMVVAHNESQDKLKELREAFLALDKDNSGSIGVNELKELLQRHGVQDNAEIEKYFNNIDSDKQGGIRYMEFLAATIEMINGALDADTLSKAFDHLDVNMDGEITRENLRELLGQDLSAEEVDEILLEADLSGDGVVSKQEFIDIMLRNEKSARVTEKLKNNIEKEEDGADLDHHHQA